MHCAITDLVSPDAYAMHSILFGFHGPRSAFTQDCTGNISAVTTVDGDRQADSVPEDSPPPDHRPVVPAGPSSDSVTVTRRSRARASSVAPVPPTTRREAQKRRTPARPLARHAAPESGSSRRRRGWRNFWIALSPLGLVLVGTVILGGVFALQVLEVRDDLETVKSQLGGLAEAAVSADVDRLQQAGDEVVARTQRASDTANGPLWDLAANIPRIGNNVLAVRTVAEAVNAIASQSIPPVVNMVAAANVDQQRAEGSLGINLQPFLEAATVLPTVISSFEEASTIAASMDRTDVLPAVYEPMDEMVGLLNQAVPILKVAQENLPALLKAAGANGPMLYQVMIQTPAEIRATGGGVAHWLILKVDNGQAELVGQDNGVDLMYSRLPSLGFDTENGSLITFPRGVQSLYPPELDNWSSNFTMTPEFPRAVDLFKATREWEDLPTFDGAISIDPIVLAHLIEATGPLTLASGEQVTAENTGALLMSEPYERFGADNAAMDAFFNEVTSTMFSTLTSGNWEFGPMWDQLVRSAGEGRIQMWFDDPGLEAFATQYGLDAALREDNTDATQLGIYFNDYSIGKLNYHLAYDQHATCNVDERTITVTMNLHNSITEDIKSAYTLGLRNANRGIDPRTMMLDVLFFAPPGGEILWTDPKRGDWQDGTFHDRSGVDHGNKGLSRTLLLPMGESRTVSYEVQLPEGPLGPLQLRHTPGANDTQVTVDASCASLFASPEGSTNVSLTKIG